MAGDLNINNLTCASINNESIAKGFNPILAEFEVTGSAVTSIDFSGLDINAHGGSYEVELRLVNATASPVDIYMYANNQTTPTDYYNQYVSANGAGLAAARINNPRVGGLLASANTLMEVKAAISAGFFMFNSNATYGNGANILSVFSNGMKTATVANITQLTFVSSVALAIGIGSKIIIRRKDK